MKKHYCEILGIPLSASPKEIKDAYRRLAKIYHPDMPNGDVSEFARISEAHFYLTDKKLNPFSNGQQTIEGNYLRLEKLEEGLSWAEFFRKGYEIIRTGLKKKKPLKKSKPERESIDIIV